ncbi:MAG: type II secretion system protein M [Gammaproteobacteria bacterium]
MSLQQLRQWFMALEKRERMVLAGGGLILCSVIIYAGILSPYLSHRHALLVQVREQRARLAWMRPAANRIKLLSAKRPTALPGGSLLSTVNSSAAGVGLGSALQQAQQESDGSVRVQLSAAAFDSLVRWLSDMRQTYGVMPSDMTVERGSGPGLVNASIKLRPPP